jgi:hypothetical protein
VSHQTIWRLARQLATPHHPIRDGIKTT